VLNVEIPGTDTAAVDAVLSRLEKHQERLGCVSLSTSLPPLAQIFRDIFEHGLARASHDARSMG
jgi:hypothetical protein